jgi:hypothetical protein
MPRVSQRIEVPQPQPTCPSSMSSSTRSRFSAVLLLRGQRQRTHAPPTGPLGAHAIPPHVAVGVLGKAAPYVRASKSSLAGRVHHTSTRVHTLASRHSIYVRPPPGALLPCTLAASRHSPFAFERASAPSTGSSRAAHTLAASEPVHEGFHPGPPLPRLSLCSCKNREGAKCSSERPLAQDCGLPRCVICCSYALD